MGLNRFISIKWLNFNLNIILNNFKTFTSFNTDTKNTENSIVIIFFSL